MATRSPEQLAFEAAIRENLRQRAQLLGSTLGQAERLLKGLSATITALLAQQPAEWQQLQLQRVQLQVQALVDGLQGSLAQQVDGGLQKAWQLGVAGIDAPLAAASIHVEVFMPALDASLLTAMRSFTEGRIKDLATQATAAVDQAIHLAVLGAQTPQQAIKQVQTAVGGPEGPALTRARRIVVTSLGQAYGAAGQQRKEQAQAFVPDLQKQWRRSGKIHSRWNHDAMDGVVVDADKPFLVPTKGAGAFVKMMHPHDPKAPPEEVINCGCIARPWLSRWGLPTGGTPFSERELKLNPLKRASAAWIGGRLATKR